ncbi:hypothetical protein J4405_04635 [Candidatus Woesearchaeota archaeon]|nr:hypothetical protein [Candidatus Woesearchaeota archaeon]
MEDKKKIMKLKKVIRELEAVKGRHTELVSVYIPKDYDIIKIIQHLEQEQGTASNIKDKNTRKNVIDSLERAIRFLRLYKSTPENGLAIFCGDASESENKTDIKVWSIEPPVPLQIRLYRCDQVFVLDPLKDMMNIKDNYGLIILDNREATIGILSGTSITTLFHLTSGVPGKIKAGGQCLNPETLIQLTDGNIILIKDSSMPCLLKSANLNNKSIEDSAILNKWENKKEVTYKIITKFPRLEIEASKDHIFFTNSFEEKSSSELNIGDHLLMPEKIEVKGSAQILHPEEHKTLTLPKVLNKNTAQILGYFLGDGNYEEDRLTFSERDKSTLVKYQNLIKKAFNANTSLRFRESKNYYQLRVYGRALVRLFRNEFPELKKALDSQIPIKILKSHDEILKLFLKGLFDTEGYATKDELSIGMNNKILIHQLQLSLLRFGIIGSLCTYDNKCNPYSKKTRYTLRITEKQSLKNFQKNINFTFKNKRDKLAKLIKNRTEKNYVRQIITQGSSIRKIIEKAGLNIQHFPKVTNFFRNERQMSKNIFNSSILKEIKNNKQLYSELKNFSNYNLIPVKIKSIEKINKEVPMVDIEVRNRNFIANGLIVHNSQARFARLREGAAHEFYKRIAEVSNKEFYNNPKIRGILIGGPGPTKETFFEGNYLNNEVKKKVLTTQDLSYTEDYGLRELVDKSKDVLAEESITKEKKLMLRFLEMLAKDNSKAAYGKANVKKAIEYGAVEILLISESLDNELIEEYIEAVEKFNSTYEIISIDTNEGVQLKELGGIAAILRYPVN